MNSPLPAQSTALLATIFVQGPVVGFVPDECHVQTVFEWQYIVQGTARHFKTLRAMQKTRGH
jgi:hypothetical protein